MPTRASDIMISVGATEDFLARESLSPAECLVDGCGAESTHPAEVGFIQDPGILGMLRLPFCRQHGEEFVGAYDKGEMEIRLTLDLLRREAPISPCLN